MHEIDEWCSEGIIENHRIVRKIRGGSKTTSFLAENNAGRRVMLTYLNRPKMIERLKFKAHQEGIPADELNREADRRLVRYEEELKDAVARVAGLGDDHVAVTHGIGFDREKNDVVIVSEYVPGVDFFYATRGLKPLQQISLFVQALRGLNFIHKSGFLHLNIKPSRIRADIESDQPLVKLTDFGFAIPKNGHAGEYSGTAMYMAPEIIFNDRGRINERADLYSFAVLMYYCLTEHYPTESRLDVGRDRSRLRSLVERECSFAPPSHMNKKVPTQLDGIVLKLLEKDPDRRYAGAPDLINAFYEVWPRECDELLREDTSTVEYEP